MLSIRGVGKLAKAHTRCFQGERNGVQRLRIVEREELLRMEPHINPKALAALYAPDAGVPFPFCSVAVLAVCMDALHLHVVQASLWDDEGQY